MRRHQRVTECVQGSVVLFLKCVAEMVLEGVQRSEAQAKENQLGEPFPGREALVKVLGKGSCEEHW